MDFQAQDAIFSLQIQLLICIKIQKLKQMLYKFEMTKFEAFYSICSKTKNNWNTVE